jgi:outer membrane protein OmpA-like peptidoglycan-associated protein
MPKINNSLRVLAFLAGGAIASCSSTPPPNAALDQARSSYQRAASNPQVVERAPLELKQSKEALDQADALWRDKRSADDINYQAYLASRRAEIAEQAAAIKVSQDQVNDAGAARAQAMLQSRTAQAQQAQDRAREAEQRAGQLERELADLHARQAGGGYVLTLGDILFTTGRADLKPGAAASLDQLATFLQQNPSRTVLIEGFTDSTGSEDVNLRLSQQRAEAVRAALAVRGVDSRRISTRGYGASLPVASNEDAGGRQLNRRVKVVISDPNGRIPSEATAG